MLPRRRRFWIPLFLALLSGAGVRWGVGEWLRPKPVWTLHLREGQFVGVELNRLVILNESPKEKNGDVKSVDYHAVEDGRHLFQHKPHHVESEDFQEHLPPLPDPSLPAESNRYTLSHFRQRCIILDMLTGNRYRFHNYTDDERQDVINWSQTGLVECAVVSRPQPFQLAAHLLQPLGASPADAWSRVYATLAPGSQPKMATVITVPGKQSLGSVMIQATNTQLFLQTSRTGKYLAVVSFPFDIVNTGKVIGVWNVRERQWLTSSFSSPQLLAGLRFRDDDYFITASDQGDVEERTVLWHVPTGTRVSPVDLNRSFDPAQNTVSNGDGIEFVRLARFGSPCIAEWCTYDPGTGLQVFLKWIIEGNATNRILQLFQGRQSSYFSASEPQLPDFLKQYLPTSWYQRLRTWLSAPTLHVYDWNSKQLHQLARNAFGYTCNNGEYLVVRFYQQEAGRNRHTRVEGYHMPLAFYSPWWSRTGGLLSFILLFLLLRRSRNPGPKPT
jgi:hypothetical protein